MAILLALVLIVAAGCGTKEKTATQETATTAETKTVETPTEPAKEGDTATDKVETIKIGVSPAPHAAIVELIEEDLKADGVGLEIINFDDYVTPNNALADGSIDANFFQHGPYFEEFIAKNNLDLVSLGVVHIEPMAVYSTKVKALEEIPDGGQVIIPNDPTNGGRALLLLEKNGLIKLADLNNVSATEADIVENPKNLKFVAMEAGSIARTYGDADAAVINSNFAIEAGLDPLKDGIVIESGDSPYANLVAVRKGEENEAKFQKLIKALHSEKVKKYLEDEFKGSILPAF